MSTVPPSNSTSPNATSSGSNVTELQIIQILNTMSLVCGVFAVVTNTVILAVFVRYPKLRHHDGLYLIALLAYCNWVNGCGYVVLNWYKNHAIAQGGVLWTCLLTVHVSLVGIASSQLAIIAITVDRVWAIHAPLAYRHTNHAHKALMLLVIINVYCVASNAAVFVGTNMGMRVDICRPSSGNQIFFIYWSWFKNVTSVVTIVACIVSDVDRVTKHQYLSSRKTDFY